MYRKRLFLDMDGTLARFHDQVDYLERMYEKGFFSSLAPFENMVHGIRQFITSNPDVEVFILSSLVNGKYCETEKNAWLNIYLPEIDQRHRIYTPIGKSKSEFIPGSISKDDYLLDDYNKNLNQWLYDGGNAIKCHNNINHKGLGAYGGSSGMMWTGATVHTEDSPALIATELAQHMGIAYTLKSVMEEKKDIFYSELMPGHRFSRPPRAPGKTQYLIKKHANRLHPEHFEASITSVDLRSRFDQSFKNPLNAIRWLEGKTEFLELKMIDSSGDKVVVPRYLADALALNLYGHATFVELTSKGLYDYLEVIDSFCEELRKSDLPIVGQIRYLDSGGHAVNTVVFRSVEDMDAEVQRCEEEERSITIDWFIQRKLPKEIKLSCSPDMGAPETFIISSKNLQMAAELFDIKFDNIDQFLSEYTLSDSLQIWTEYAQYILISLRMLWKDLRLGKR